MDQLSVFARRASNLNLLNATGIQLSGSDSERAEQGNPTISNRIELGGGREEKYRHGSLCVS